MRRLAPLTTTTCERLTCGRLACGLLACGLLASGCGEEFQPRSLLDRYRVIGIQADKPTARPGEVVRVRVFDFDPAQVDPSVLPPDPDDPANRISYVWAICPFSLGSASKYDCLAPELFFETLEPAFVLPLPRLDVERALDLLGEQGQARDLEGDAFDLACGLPIFIKLYSGREAVGGVDSVKKLILTTGGDPPNQNPRIVRFTVDGAAEPARAGERLRVPVGRVQLTVEVARDSAESYPIKRRDCPAAEQDTCGYCQGAGATEREELLYSWYTTAGTLRRSRTFGEARTNQLELDVKDAGPVKLFVAVRDGRGGLDVAEKVIEVVAPGAGAGGMDR